MELAEIQYINIPENKAYNELIIKVINKCFEVEEISKKNIYISVILTNPEEIRKYNKKYRKIDKETDVLSFPMFEKDEIANLQNNEGYYVLGDIIISIEQVKKQAVEYEHSFERELAYMVVHGFYHLMGYDHIEENDKIKMRKKEECILNELKICRE